MKNKHTVEIKEFEDDSGDAYIEIPQWLLKKLGWKEGDDVKFTKRDNGSIDIEKVKRELDDD
jgi:antitoxin component of MazEF toxin-antitoxin module